MATTETPPGIELGGGGKEIWRRTFFAEAAIGKKHSLLVKIGFERPFFFPRLLAGLFGEIQAPVDNKSSNPCGLCSRHSIFVKKREKGCGREERKINRQRSQMHFEIFLCQLCLFARR